MFMFGAQMGWFSLVGIDNQVPDMALYDLLMSPRYDQEIDYLQRLSSAKKVANPYFLNGRAMRRLPFLNTTNSDAIQSLAWLSSNETSLLVPITASKRYGNYKIQMTLDMTQYGFEGKSESMFDVYQLKAYDG